MPSGKKANSAKTSHPRAQAPFPGNKGRREGILKHIRSDFSAFSKDFNFKLMIDMHDSPQDADQVLRNAAMNFESASLAVVKSIKQRELLNVWLRLYARQECVPRLDDYRPDRLAEEMDDLVYFSVHSTPGKPRLVIESNGTRMSSAYGATGKGRDLDDYLGAKLAPIVVPIYHECIRRQLPVFTISKVDDLHHRKVDYERLLLPFSDGQGVNWIIGSLKAISDDGGFEIRNLMRSNDTLPIYMTRAVIDRELFHRTPDRSTPGDAIEFV
jgi:hypothetical protein